MLVCVIFWKTQAEKDNQIPPRDAAKKHVSIFGSLGVCDSVRYGGPAFILDGTYIPVFPWHQ